MALVHDWATKNCGFNSYEKYRTRVSPPPLSRATPSRPPPLAHREMEHKWHGGQYCRQDIGNHQSKYQVGLQQNEPTRLPDVSRNNCYQTQARYEPSGSIQVTDVNTLQDDRDSAPYRSGNGRSSSREGLDVSRLAFGAILKQFHRASPNTEEMDGILNRFLEYDAAACSPIVSSDPHASSVLSPLVLILSV